MDALTKAIDAVGGVTRLASLLGVKQNVVSNWKLRRKVPPERCVDVELVSGVSRHDLRPDIFGPAPEPQQEVA
jgi:DNA-binding transcriptional regulator YdaS (Cro superfamily)